MAKQCEAIDIQGLQCYRESIYQLPNGRTVCWCHQQTYHDETRQVSFIAPAEQLELPCVPAAE